MSSSALHVELLEDLVLVAPYGACRGIIRDAHQQPRQRLTHLEARRVARRSAEPYDALHDGRFLEQLAIEPRAFGAGHVAMCTLGGRPRIDAPHEVLVDGLAR